MKKIYKCVIGNFNIDEAFIIVDLLQDPSYLSVSCVQKSKKWIVEILSNSPQDKVKLHKLLKGFDFLVLENKPLEDVDWLQKCFENFKPITIGSFYVYGPHLRTTKHPADKINIEIAAATAFGTGEHATTNRCLIAAETFFDSEKHKSVLDLGCGSCILSIALAKLGARNISAYDNDPEAVRISRENIVINHVAHQVNVLQNKSDEFGSRNYDFIVANILAEPLISMSEIICKCLNKKGIVVLSGFNYDAKSVEQKFTSLGLNLKFKYDYKGWTTLVLEKL